MQRRRAFSLLELVMSMFLISLLTALAFVNLNQRRSKYPCQALADTVAEQLRLARQTAITEQQPIAVGMPSQGGTTPVSQSLYLATGHSMAHVTKVLNFSSSYPGQVLFQGMWGGGYSIFPRTAGGTRESFVAAPWLLNPHMPGYQMPLDYCLVFTPDGGVTSNGLPLHNGAYHIVVAAGAIYTPGASPTSVTGEASALSYFQATALGSPYQVEVLTTGAVRVVAGLGQPFNTSDQAVVAVAPAPPVLDLPLADPQSASVTILPTPTISIPGVNVTLVAGQRVTMAVNATDASGHDVFVEWKSQRNSANASASNGTFSMQGSQPMHWDVRTRQWMASWDWICPLDAAVDDKFAFSCEFGDGTGRVVPGPAGPTVLSIPASPQIFYNCASSAASPVPMLVQVIQANCDGSMPREKVSFYSRWSTESNLNRQGSLYYHNTGAIYSTKTGQVVGNFLKLGWAHLVSPDGNWGVCDAPDAAGHLAAVATHRPASNIRSVIVASRSPLRANPAWVTGLVADSGVGIAGYDDSFVWSPDQKHLVYVNGDGLHVLDLLESPAGLTASADRVLPGTPGMGSQNMVSWTPDSSQFYFSSDPLNGGRVSLADATTMAITALPQLNGFSQTFLDGVRGVTPQPPAADGSRCWATVARLAPAGDKLYMIDANGKLSTTDVNTGVVQTLSQAPKGVQAWRLMSP